jgi:hypothetical protein
MAKERIEMGSESVKPTRLGTEFGKVQWTLPLMEQEAYVESYIDDYWPCQNGETKLQRNIRIRKEKELNPWELYALCRGTFISKSPQYRILLCGSDGQGGRKDIRNTHAQPVFLKFHPYMNRMENGGKTSFSLAELEMVKERDGKAYVQFGETIREFASKADVLIPTIEFEAAFGTDPAITLMKGKKFCDEWRTATTTRQELLMKIALFHVKQIVLSHDLYATGEQDKGFWLERRGERSYINALREAEEANERVSSLAKSLGVK